MLEHPLCAKLHTLITSGKCPWCDCRIRFGIAHACDDKADSATLCWNVEGIVQSLTQEDEEIQLIILSDILLRKHSLQEVLPILRNGLSCPKRRMRWLASNALTKNGGNLSREAAMELEEALVFTPADAAIRISLLGYYFPRSSYCESSRKARYGHIMWLVQCAPELAFPGNPDTSVDPVGEASFHRELERCWLKQVETRQQEPVVLGNAASFFASCNLEYASNLLKLALKLDPCNCEYLNSLVHQQHMLICRLNGNLRRDAALAAMVDLESLLRPCEDRSTRLYCLPSLANIAVESGRLDRARALATELIEGCPSEEQFPEAAFAYHHGNLVLGRIALRLGNLLEATNYLLEASNVEGSPVLETGGPNMILAQELLNRGERAVVARYLRSCVRFWHTPDHRPEQWASLIERGGLPDLSGNLFH